MTGVEAWPCGAGGAAGDALSLALVGRLLDRGGRGAFPAPVGLTLSPFPIALTVGLGSGSRGAAGGDMARAAAWAGSGGMCV